MNTYWFEFLRTGKPQAEGNPVWQSHDEANDITMEFGETIALSRGLYARAIERIHRFSQDN